VGPILKSSLRRIGAPIVRFPRIRGRRELLSEPSPPELEESLVDHADDALVSEGGAPSLSTESNAVPAAKFDPRDLIPAPIFCVSADGWILWANGAAEDLTGRPAKDLVGQSFAILFAEQDRTRLARPFLKNRRRGKGDFHCQIPVQSANGTQRWIGMHVRLATSSQGRSAYVCAGNDLHDLHSELERSRLEIKEGAARIDAVTASAQMRGDYLTSLSYELRSPMNGLVAMSRLLLDTQLDRDQRTLAEILQNSSVSLLQLVDDMLDFAKIESGKLEIEHLAFDLRVAVETVSSQLAPASNEVRMSFASRIHHRVPSRLQGDAGRLRQIIRCVGTALLQLTEEGEVRLAVELDQETAHQVSLRLLFDRVSEGGIVALPPSLETFRGESDTFMVGDQGTSLALGMARRLILLMGGSCGVEKQGGENLRLWLSLPFTKQPAVVDAPAPAFSGATLAGVRVLVADPVRADREQTVRVFTEAGCVCEEAQSGSEALARIRQAASRDEAFAICFLDFELSELESDEVAHHLQSGGELARTCLIQTTSLGRRGDAARAEAAGFAGYLVKPVPAEDLQAAALEVLRRHAASGEEGATLGLVTRHSVAEQRRRETRILLVEDNPLDQLVVSMVLQRIGYHPRLATGYDAALTTLQSEPFDLVLMDLVLPDHTGWDLTTAVRSHEGPNRETPIVAVTGRIGDEDRARCLDVGMNDFLAKPIDLETLATTVERWTRPSETPAAAEEAPAESANGHTPEVAHANGVVPATWWSELESLPVLDEEQLAQSSMGNQEIRDMLVESFFERLRQPADRLRQALEDGNPTQATYEAHSMKGMCASLGAARCAEIYRAIEEGVDGGRLDGYGPLLDRGDTELREVERRLGPERPDRLAA